jgi:N6-adenosine-specific RNA methylase IME4
MTKYKVILADPPWSFATYSRKGKGRSAEAWYDTMSMAEIMAFPVEEMADDHCMLFLWVTDPQLETAFSVIKRWGFTYKTVGFYWIKTSKDGKSFPISTGYYTRANPEQCLLATRGYPRRRFADVPKLIVAPRREHSRKPDEIYPRIKRLASGPYLELFSRYEQPGWDTLGDEKGMFNTGGKPIRRWRSDGYDIPEVP